MKRNIVKAVAMMFAAVILQSAAVNAAEYSDVPASHWAHGNIEYISELGIASGYDDGTYRPEAAILIQTLISRAVGMGGYTNAMRI